MCQPYYEYFCSTRGVREMRIFDFFPCNPCLRPTGRSLVLGPSSVQVGLGPTAEWLKVASGTGPYLG